MVVFESFSLYSLLLCLIRLLCPGLLGVCHTSRKHWNQCILLWNFNIYIALVLYFVKCFFHFLILLNVRNNLVNWAIFPNFICCKPRIQIFKWFPQVNTSKLGNFILSITQIYYCSEVLSSVNTSLKWLHSFPTSYNIRTKFVGHKSETLKIRLSLPSQPYFSLPYFLLPSCSHNNLVELDHSSLSNINFVMHLFYHCLCHSFKLVSFLLPLTSLLLYLLRINHIQEAP